MKREAINKLQQIIDTHRSEAFVTCEETCWCWDVEGVIHSLELSISPTEGAEEILYGYFSKEYLDNSEEDGGYWMKPHILAAMQNFATLHTQKMVEERLRETCQACGDTTEKDLHCNCCGNNFPI